MRSSGKGYTKKLKSFVPIVMLLEELELMIFPIELRRGETDDISNRANKREIQQGKRKRYGGKDIDDVLIPINNDDMTEKDVEAATQGLAFIHVKTGNDDGRARKKAKKLSKLQLLELAKKLQEDKKDPKKGEVVAKKHSWQAATSRAARIKVHYTK